MSEPTYKIPDHMTVVEIDRQQIEEMLRAYLIAKFRIPVTPWHRVSMTMFPDKMVVRVHAQQQKPVG